LHYSPSGAVDVVTIELLGQEFVLLSAVPEAEQCGWLKDKYGLSWQIVPTAMGDMLKDKDMKKLARVTEAFLKMKKFDIQTLKRAYEGTQDEGGNR
jgi:predicted 3-demethylubiquinone-9 3-methyltransferase (glyoxalase superfamily)